MISAIIMNNCASYKDEQIMDDCKTINFVYGANGSGKSTISNFLLDRCNILYKDSKIIDFDENLDEIIVYNKVFRESNFGKDSIDGIFTLGEQNIEVQNKIDELKTTQRTNLDNIQNMRYQLSQKNSEIQRKEDELKNFLWEEIYKKYENIFSIAFIGYKNNKEKLKDNVLSILEFIESNVPVALELESLKKRGSILFNQNSKKCNLYNIDLLKSLNDRIQKVEKNHIWAEKIIGKDDIPIARLITFLGNSEWVSRGRNYIDEKGICPFCQHNTIDDNFKKQLSDFFDHSYTEKIESLKYNLNEYQSAIEEIDKQINTVLSDTIYATIGELDPNNINQNLVQIMKLTQENIGNMKNKIDGPSNIITIRKTKSYIDNIILLINNANLLLERYNDMIDNQGHQIKVLTHDIWLFLVKENMTYIKNLLKEIKDFKKGIDGINKRILHFQNKAKELERQLSEQNKRLTSILPTIDEINRLLKAYGFNTFKIVPSPEENKYQIKRDNGQLATHTLSEGEETFITFLYFMQLVKGTQNPLNTNRKKILIIDDPISSLDSTILYVVSAIIKDLIEQIEKNRCDVEQLFIFTHNVFFHKEVSFVPRGYNTKGNRKFWIINKDSGQSKINSHGSKNPISTSYELLWTELKNNTSSSIVTIQNTMRRIIENYFRILGSSNTQCTYIESQFSTIEEKMICKALFAWINDGSHVIPDDLHIDSYSDSIDKYKDVFHQIFVKTGHSAHYDMMMK